MRRALALLAALLIMPSLPAESSAEPWSKSDGPNDVVLDAGAPVAPGVATNPYADHVDLTQVRFEDPNEATLLIHLKNVAGFKTGAPPPSGSTGWNLYARYAVVFMIPSQEGARAFAIAELDSDIPVASPGEGRVARARLCLTGAETATRCSYDMPDIPLGFQVAGGEVTLAIPKRALEKQPSVPDRFTRAPPPLPDRLPAGSEITRIVVHASVSFMGRLYDRMPDTGTGYTYALTNAGPASDLDIRADARAVVAGETSLVNLRIQNNGTAKRLLNLSVVPEHGSWPEGWKATVTPSIAVGAGRVVNATLQVTAPAGSQDLTLLVYGRAVNERGTTGLGVVALRAVPPLDADNARWILHANHRTTPLLPAGPFASTAYGYAFLSRILDDPRAVDDVRVRNDRSSTAGGSSLLEWNLDQSLDAVPNPALFRPGQTGSLHLAIQAGREASAELSFRLFAGPRELARHQSTRSLAAGPNEMDLPLTVTKDAQRLEPADGSLRATLQLRVDAVNALGFSGSFDEIALLPKKTTFALPLERDQEGITLSTRRLVTLSPAEDLDGFVNPGRQRVVELDLRNGEPSPVRVRLGAVNVSAGWDARVAPGATLRLAANDSVRIALLLRAPAHAAEADAVAVRLEAVDVATAEVLATATVKATVTRGAEFPNETFEAGNEDIRKVETPAGSPGPAPLLVASVLGAVGWIWRRRQDPDDKPF